jgi:hypothetical protein
MRVALLVAVALSAGGALASAHAGLEEHRKACGGHATSIADPIGDVRVQSDPRVHSKQLVRATDIRHATVVLSRRASCATVGFVRRPLSGRLSVGVWLLDTAGHPLAVDAVYADFAKSGVHAGRVTTSSRTLDPSNVRLAITGSNVWFRFRLKPRLLPGGELQLARIAWRIAMTSTLANKRLAALDTAPSDRRLKPRGVRQSDGRLVPLP